MIKVTKVVYLGENVFFKNESFTNGKEYFIWKSKDGRFNVINMDNGIERIFRTDIFTVGYDNSLRGQFIDVCDLFFINQREFREKVFS